MDKIDRSDRNYEHSIVFFPTIFSQKIFNFCHLYLVELDTFSNLNLENYSCRPTHHLIDYLPKYNRQFDIVQRSVCSLAGSS